MGNNGLQMGQNQFLLLLLLLLLMFLLGFLQNFKQFYIKQ